jgi:hypothetical protein
VLARRTQDLLAADEPVAQVLDDLDIAEIPVRGAKMRTRQGTPAGRRSPPEHHELVQREPIEARLDDGAQPPASPRRHRCRRGPPTLVALHEEPLFEHMIDARKEERIAVGPSTNIRRSFG